MEIPVLFKPNRTYNELYFKFIICFNSCFRSNICFTKAIAVGDILAFFQYVKNFTQPIQQITKIMDMLQTAMAASERIFEFLEHDDEIESGSLEINDLKESIEFDNVHFGYGSEEIIKGITFEVKRVKK